MLRVVLLDVAPPLVGYYGLRADSIRSPAICC
jgi:hypothetical protein